MPNNDTAYYLGLPYTFTLSPDLSDGGFVIKVDELPGCISQGETVEEAREMIREAMRLWIESALKHGDRIPEPGNQARSKTAFCSHCQRETPVLRIVWGYPMASDFERAERGEIALGGCVLPDEGKPPRWRCQVCGHDL